MYLSIPVPPLLPRSGGAITKWIGRWGLRLVGWHIEGELPNLPKLVIIVAPHTSNWDFVIGMSARLALSLDAKWLGKHTIFRAPFGGLLRKLGGIPVDRSAPRGVVADAVLALQRSERMVIGIAPEGTRKAAGRWRSGFYHIAVGAAVPILPVALDWRTRTLRLGSPFVPTGNAEADVPLIQALYRDVARWQ